MLTENKHPYKKIISYMYWALHKTIITISPRLVSVPNICDCMGEEIYSAHRFQNLKQAGKLKAVRKLSVQDCSVPVSSASCT